MKFLYVLVSNSSDYYSEQCFLSIYSLKLRNENASVSLLVDSQTSEYLHKCFEELIELVNEIKVVELNEKLRNKEKSRILKTTMRRYIDGDFMFIDCDTIICNDLSEIEKFEYNIGCVFDSHVLVNNHWAKNWLTKNYKKCGFIESIAKNTHYNSGIIYCKDNISTRKFFNDWANLLDHSLKKGIQIDQPSFNQADTLNGNIIHELHGKWNCQLMQGGVKYLHEAYIIHYFASQSHYSNPYALADKNLLIGIRNEKKITKEYRALLAEPKSAVNVKSSLISPDVSTEIFFHQPFSELLYIYEHNHFLYKLLRCAAWLFARFHR